MEFPNQARPTGGLSLALNTAATDRPTEVEGVGGGRLVSYKGQCGGSELGS